MPLDELMKLVGWVLVHFVWQGLLIGGLFGFWQIILRRNSANTRYLVGCTALALMAVFPLVTGYWLYLNHPVDAQLGTNESTISTNHSGQMQTVDSVSRTPVIGGKRDLSSNQHKPFKKSSTSKVTERSSVNTSNASSGTFKGRMEPAFPWLVGLWFVGVVVFAVRFSKGWWWSWGILRDGIEPMERLWDVILTTQ